MCDNKKIQMTYRKKNKAVNILPGSTSAKIDLS